MLPGSARETAMDRLFERVAQTVASWAGRPPAFALAFIIVAVWGITGPIFAYSNTWQLVINTGTTIVTFLMVFLIQNAQNRDGSAIQAKLDEIIRATIDARNAFIGIEHLTQVELEQIKTLIEKECSDGPAGHEAIERMLGRL
jgi:low affinity Fe/Cu permease